MLIYLLSEHNSHRTFIMWACTVATTILNYCLLLFNLSYWWMIGCHDVRIWLTQWWISGSIWCQWNQKMVDVRLFYFVVFIRWCRVKYKGLSNEALTIFTMLSSFTRYAYALQPGTSYSKSFTFVFQFLFFFSFKAQVLCIRPPLSFFPFVPSLGKTERKTWICHLLTV